MATGRQLDPHARALLDVLDQAGGPALNEMSPEDARVYFAAGRDFFAADPEPVASVEDIHVEHLGHRLEMRAYRPNGGDGQLKPGLVYFHGGGWVLGDLESQDPLCRKLCNASGAVIVSVNYGHAPEVRFPVANEEAAAAFDYVSSHAATFGIDDRRLAIGGESAGGAIAAVVAQREAGDGRRRIAAQLLCYPVTDLTRSETAREPQQGYFVTAPMLRWFTEHYLGDADPADPAASPLRSEDLSGLPPTILILCGFDPLLQEGIDYRDRLVDAGVSVTTRLYPGQIHAFLTMDRQIPEAHDAIVEIARLLRQSLAP